MRTARWRLTVGAILCLAAAGPATWAEPQPSPALELARAIEAGYAAGDATPFLEAFDLAALGEASPLGLPVEVAASLSPGLARSLSEATLAKLEAGGTFRLLRVRTVDGTERAVFRLGTWGVGFLYHEYLLVERDGRIRIGDVYVSTAGERLTRTLRRTLRLAEAVRNPAAVAQLGGAERALAESAPLVERFYEHRAAGEHAEALATWAQMPAEVQDDKSLLLGAVGAAQEGGERQRLLERYRAVYPNDPGLAFLMMDVYVARRDFAGALACYDDLERRMGGPDAFLTSLRGVAQFEMGDPDAAERSFREAIGMEPKFEPPYWGLVNLQLSASDWPGVARTLRAFEHNTGKRVSGLAELPAYADFVATAEYREWIAGHSP